MKKSTSKTLKEVISERDNDYSFLEKKYTQIGVESSLLDPFALPQYSSLAPPLTVSIVIPAFNVKGSILACLTSIEQSSFNLNYQNRLQVVVVDDGSTDGTWEIIKQFPFSMHLTAVKQNNHGQACALNTGISVAEGDIIISCDADMVLSYHAIGQFVARHQQIPNALLTGFRLDTPKTDPRVDHNLIRKYGSHQGSYFAKDERIVYPVSGWPNNMCLASDNYKRLGYSRGLWMPDDKICKDPWLLSDLVIGALFSLPREIFLNVGGYDERLHGWGSTDGLLAAKAISNSQFIIPVYAASGLHISHPFRTTDKQLEYSQNRKRFFEIIQTEKINSYPNWITKAKIRIIESFTKSPTQASFKPHKNRLNFEDDEFFWNKIDSLLAIGDYSEASIVISTYSMSNSDPKKLLRLGKISFGLGEYQETINVLKEISSTRNYELEATIQLSAAHAAIGEFATANTVLKELAEVNVQASSLSYWHKTSAQEHINQGEKYFNQGFYDIALRCFEAALIIDSRNKEALKRRDLCIS
ncbi:MAG: glycosyltransferase [Candidatus Levybacteria bacterium]|nr:glycosyltransferase [Candidatus Levybacteria bacterium]